jgi:hypothetical protein
MQTAWDAVDTPYKTPNVGAQRADNRGAQRRCWTVRCSGGLGVIFSRYTKVLEHGVIVR